MILQAGKEVVVLPEKQNDFYFELQKHNKNVAFKRFDDSYHELLGELEKERVVESLISFISNSFKTMA